jgi:riboflavin biosynthesis pyrimidine reductase
MFSGSAEQRRPLRVVLSSGLRIETEPSFDGAELRRLIAALEAAASQGRMARAV